MERGKLNVGRGETDRIRTRDDSDGRKYSQEMTYLTGEYIDQFTTVPDLRTTEEILSQVPKCCVGRPQVKKSMFFDDSIPHKEKMKEFKRLCERYNESR